MTKTNLRLGAALGATLLGLALPASASLSSAACSEDGPALIVDDQPEKKTDEKKKAKTVTVWVLDAKGKGWSASKMARAAMDTVEGIDRLLMSGTRATFTMQEDAKPDLDDIKAALKSKRVTFVSLTKEERKPSTAYVLKCPGFTWAKTAGKVREALMNDVPGVTDAFCGTSTVLHFDPDQDLDLDEVKAAVKRVLKANKIKLKGEISEDASKKLS